MTVDFGALNWLAILVAAIAWFVFSAIWYSVQPISRAWQRAAGVTMDTGGPALVWLMIPTFIGYFVTTTVIALVAKGLGSDTVGAGLTLGIVLGIGFGVVGALVTQLYERKGDSYWLINGVNAVIAFSIVGMIVSVWD